MGGFTKVGGWDSSQNVFLLSGSAESNFRIVDENTGFANLYNGPKAISTINATLVNFTTTYGYIFNGRMSLYRSDGVDDYTTFTNMAPQISGKSSLTFHYWVNIPTTSPSNLAYLWSILKDGTNLFRCYITGGNLVIGVRNGSSESWSIPLTGFPINTDALISIVYAGAETNKFKMYLNGVFFGNVGSSVFTSLSTYTTEIFQFGYNNSATQISDILQVSMDDCSATAEQVLDFYNLGLGLGGLLGADLTGGEMSLSDNRVELYNNYQNLATLASSIIPWVADDNTTDIPLIQAEGYLTLITAVLSNFPTNYGYIAESGGVPAHILFDGVNSKITMNNLRPTYDNDSTLTAIFKFRLNAIGQYHALASQYIDGNNSMLMTVVSTNVLRFQFEKSGVSHRVDGTSLLSVGVDYSVKMCKIGSELKIFLDDVEETYGVDEAYNHGTFAPAIDFTIGDRGGLPFNGRMYDVRVSNEPLSESFTKDQNFSSKNEWHGLKGIEEVDGSLTPVEVYKAFDAQQVWSELNSGVSVQNEWGTGRVGRFATFNTDKTFSRFDLTNLFGEAVSEVRLLFFTDNVNNQPYANKIIFKNQTNDLVGVVDAPQASDLSSLGINLASIEPNVVTGENSYEYTPIAEFLNDAIQDQIDEVIEQDDGFLLIGQGNGDVGSDLTKWFDTFSVKLLIKLKSGVFLPPPYIFKMLGGL